ncbi:DUF262 domain-containing protein [Arthrobacter bambusae]|uniref:DUF262 domain-containing protein n=1 Tax=Arthrobacter bambusae TaxID=1338426 RepID=UPI002786C65A|nr:DUF262 domain-containing protein [Arthrobacter bambusae]MDQ0212150.1 hypothetical protein [Arthrobacter bambusae]MDQ0236632.1 hypothetical protein [Arthrobacter bambusae]
MVEKTVKSKIHAAEQPLNQIFSPQFEFSIPDYQRPYAWGGEQTSQLLSDITEAQQRNPEEPYFLGSLVLVKEEGNPKADVIDGQQRLTTLSILLAVLRELSENPQVRSEMHEYIVEPGRITAGIASNPRLHLRARDREFFTQYIQDQGKLQELLGLSDGQLKTDAQAAIRDNARLLHDQLVKLSEEQRMALIMMLTLRTFLVMVSTEDLDSAHRIFSVMNARGLDLSAADIFKAELIGRVPEHVRGGYADKWEVAEVELGRDGFADLFQHIRMIMTRVRGRQEILKEFREQVLDPYLKESTAASFIDEVLLPYADAYGTVIDRSYQSAGSADRINKWLVRFGQLDNQDWVPPVLWALKHHGNDEQWLDTFLQKLERLAATMLIRREYQTPRAQRYANLLRDLDAGLGLDAPSLDLEPSERLETLVGLSGPIYEARRVVKYVLLRLDETLTGNSGVTYEHPIITVEHVLPQNPHESSEWRSAFTDEERLVWTHRLANLVLLNRRKNAEASNREFDHKKSRYFSGPNGSAPFTLTIQVNGTSEWTPAILEVRQQQLMDRLANLWSLS